MVETDDSEVPEKTVPHPRFLIQVISGVKPAEKKKFINELQMNKNIVAMVGDGINDAAALASSDVGVAMGGGAGAASEVSPVVLMGNRLTQVCHINPKTLVFSSVRIVV